MQIVSFTYIHTCVYSTQEPTTCCSKFSNFLLLCGNSSKASTRCLEVSLKINKKIIVFVFKCSAYVHMYIRKMRAVNAIECINRPSNATKRRLGLCFGHMWICVATTLKILTRMRVYKQVNTYICTYVYINTFVVSLRFYVFLPQRSPA